MNFEFEILEWIQNNLRIGVLDHFFSKFTVMGEWGLLWIIFAIFLILNKKTRKIGILVLVGIGLGAIIGNLGIKNLVARIRPCEIRKAYWLERQLHTLVFYPKERFSFPSGHALSSAIAATIIFLGNKKYGIFAIILAALMAFSRLYLHVHFPTDVLGGIAIGIVIGVIVWFGGGKLYDKIVTKISKKGNKELQSAE